MASVMEFHKIHFQGINRRKLEEFSANADGNTQDCMLSGNY